MPETDVKFDAEVTRVLASADFLASPNLSSLLGFLATNRSGGLKESVIAGEFFGRHDYDSKIDSLVRTEIRRLRLKLTEHYANAEDKSVVRLEIPKGCYEVVLRDIAPIGPVPATEKLVAAAVHPPVGLRPLRWMFPALRSAAVGTAVLVAALFSIWLSRRIASTTAKPPRTVAILPFSVLQPFPSKSDATSLSDDLVARLAANRVIRVTAGSSTAAFKDAAASVRDIGRALAADVLVRGSARAGPGRTIILSATAVVAETGLQIWSGTAAGRAERLSSLEDQLVSSLLASFGLDPPPPLFQPKPEALDAYLEARLVMHSQAPRKTEDALRLLERSARLDLAFALPLTNAAAIYLIAANNGTMDPAVVTPKASALLTRSLAIDPLSADAHVVAGDLHYNSYDWEAARQAYFRAISLNPSSANAYYHLGLLLMAERRFDEAEASLQQASQLSPLWYGPPFALMELRYYQKRYPEAIAANAVFDSRFPNISDGFIAAKARFRLGSAGKVDIEKLRRDLPVLLVDAFAAIGEGRKSEGIGYLLEASQRKRDQDPRYVSAFALACSWADAGDREQAIHWLQESFQAKEPDVVSLNIDPAFDEIREDPRCRLILYQLRLRPAPTP